MVTPERAIVRPRVTHEGSSAKLPLDVIILALATRHANGVVFVCGAPGLGRTSVLRHIAATVEGRRATFLFDTGSASSEGIRKSDQGLCFIAMGSVSASFLKLCRMIPGIAIRDALWLAPWDQDDVIEYLLAAHPTRTADVMARLKAHCSE